MDRHRREIAPAPEAFSRHLQLVRDYVVGSPGSHNALLAAARREPEELTMSIVALGAVLLDLASEAFHMTPEQMLDKVGRSIEEGAS